MVAGMLALTTVLLAGCGGGSDDQAKVEASLQHYLLSSLPQDAGFPIGAGTPRVKDNGCFKREGAAWPEGAVWPGFDDPRAPDALWQCVVTFGTYAMPVTVAVDDNTEVVGAAPGLVLRKVLLEDQVSPACMESWYVRATLLHDRPKTRYELVALGRRLSPAPWHERASVGKGRRRSYRRCD